MSEDLRAICVVRQRVSLGLCVIVAIGRLVGRVKMSRTTGVSHVTVQVARIVPLAVNFNRGRERRKTVSGTGRVVSHQAVYGHTLVVNPCRH